MAENTIIIDCYTDEPAGLGVPPYIGTYPRYIAGWIKHHEEDYSYLTIDDLRLLFDYNGIKKEPKESEKTNIRIHNTTRSPEKTKEIIDNAGRAIIISGVHTPGKYLSAVPGTWKEIAGLAENISCEKILTGPAVFGSSVEGGRKAEKARSHVFDRKKSFDFSYDEIAEYAVEGAEIIRQVPQQRIIELETGRGCSRKKGCSFCTEPVKNRNVHRNEDDVLKEAKALYSEGAVNFRLGKQSCFYSYPSASSILKNIRKECKKLNVLHIDNASPANVLSEKGKKLTADIVKYCTPGNVAAFGVESFDSEVAELNNLNSFPEQSYEAVRDINRQGATIGENGMPKFLPGINLLFGLEGESKKTHYENMRWLKRILDEKLMLRRINIRQVNVFEGTPLYGSAGTKFLRKNRKYYWKWRDEIRQKIDFPMLGLVAPKRTVLRNLYAEIYDGKTTFARQIGTYPLIAGIKGRLALGTLFDAEVESHMLRSIVAKPV